MIHGEFINASKPGYVRLNGRTIGNAGLGASERATGLNNTNSDVFNLFQYLYNNVHEAIAIVSGGRTPSGAIADFNANKNIVLPDCRGSTFVGSTTWVILPRLMLLLDCYLILVLQLSRPRV